jgi:cell division protein FtsB
VPAPATGAAEPPGAPDDADGPRPSLTGRAVILAVVVGAVVVSLVLPVREFLTQRAALDGLAEQADQSAARVADLQAAERRWDDPSYVAAQARERLHFVLPGEVGYVVVGAPEAGGDPAAGADPAAPPQTPWYAKVWQSVQAAGSTAAPSPSPSTTVRPDAPR